MYHQLIGTIGIILLLTLSQPLAARSGSGASQAELDAACEFARKVRIEADKDFLVDECVQRKFKRDRPACERFYADHGNQAGSRAPLYYDLPECVIAFENSKKARR